MMNSSSNFRRIMPEMVPLKPEHYVQATESCRKIVDSDQQWQTYIGTLAHKGVTSWLEQHNSALPITTDSKPSKGSCTILYCSTLASPFRLYIIAVEQVLDGLIQLPASLMVCPAHHYLFTEVLDDRQELILLGVLTFERLQSFLASLPPKMKANNDWPIPLSGLDPEPEHLLHDYAFTIPSNIDEVPQLVADAQAIPNINDINTSLQDWLTDTVLGSWQMLTEFNNPTASLVLSTRAKLMAGNRRAKRIILDPEQPHLVLVMEVEQDEDSKLRVLVQLHPTQNQETLPETVALRLRSHTGKELQVVQAELQDSYIQLCPFRVKPLQAFSVSITLSDVSWSETFAS